MKTCFFIGHRDAPEEVLPQLEAAVETHVAAYGVTDFVVGGYGRFDALAARAVLGAKKRHPEVRLTLLLPYHPALRPVPTPAGFDGTYYPPGLERVPRRAAIVGANRAMVAESTHLIAYVLHPSGGSRPLLDYALARQRRGLIAVTRLKPAGNSKA